MFDFLDPWVMNLLVCLIIAAITEITSNTAIASLAMPIMFELVKQKTAINRCINMTVYTNTFNIICK